MVIYMGDGVGGCGNIYGRTVLLGVVIYMGGQWW